GLEPGLQGGGLTVSQFAGVGGQRLHKGSAIVGGALPDGKRGKYPAKRVDRGAEAGLGWVHLNPTPRRQRPKSESRKPKPEFRNSNHPPLWQRGRPPTKDRLRISAFGLASDFGL